MGKYLLAHDLGTSGNKDTLFSICHSVTAQIEPWACLFEASL